MVFARFAQCMTSSNPALRPSTFTEESVRGNAVPMTVSGAVQKTTVLLGLCVFAASFTWKSALTGTGGMLTIGGAIAGFIIAMILCFKHSWAPVLAPVYAICEGLLLGGVSAVAGARYGGIVVQAVALTFGTLFALLAAYQMGFIRATPGFKRGIFAATGGIALFYLISFVLGFFHIQIPFMQGGTFGILFSVFVVIIAALNLVMDFDLIENGARAGAPKDMEWYAAFGLLVTLVWLYLEILRLLSKMRER